VVCCFLAFNAGLVDTAMTTWVKGERSIFIQPEVSCEDMHGIRAMVSGQMMTDHKRPISAECNSHAPPCLGGES